ncbi:methionine aminopeptidase [Marasmius fiardii PR-910]|nr:methionine aminopeptidase [Marasmius fiardii PR-910]
MFSRFSQLPRKFVRRIDKSLVSGATSCLSLYPTCFYPHCRTFTSHSNTSGDVEEDAYNFGHYSVILPEEPFVFGVSHITPRTVPKSIRKPLYALTGRHDTSTQREELIRLGGIEEEALRRSASLARDVREFSGTLVKAGVTTNEIDAAIHEYIVSYGAYPSPLHYKGFPRSCCTSVNNIIVHGIPDDRPLEDGDVVNIDITVYLNGYHGDTSQTWLVGDVDHPGRVLCEITNKALQAGIDACGPGKHFKEIGKAIHDLAKRPFKGMDFTISQQFSGHGIGTVFHRPPWIWHHLNDDPGVMQPGHCFTIEPIIIQGRDPSGWLFPDGWTASTENCARAAQAEHMVLITEHGVDVLTR